MDIAFPNFTPSRPEGTSPRFLHLFASGVPRCPRGTLEVTLVCASQGTVQESSETLKTESKKPKVSQVDLLQRMLMSFRRPPASLQRPEGCVTLIGLKASYP